MASTDNTDRDRWRYEDNRLFCNEQYVAVLEAKDGDESTCEYIARTLDDYGRAIADYDEALSKARADLDAATLALRNCSGATAKFERHIRRFVEPIIGPPSILRADD